MRILAIPMAALALSAGLGAAQAQEPRDNNRLERREQRQENRDRSDRFEDRSRERIDRRVIVRERDRGPNVVIRERGPSVR